ncbi:uncharacterized protein LOC121430389 isoform X2 [Lytechinus variegatus]|uniref:uncharacterized protein LOC121430389 isoform X2 n=1 Tax=Lytechinus variegatus TaxID=7654 RepID=UPI001BB22018|nr:uncharacterized protein LOC121430389 isoform X2 [Lytechinus variegatus]
MYKAKAEFVDGQSHSVWLNTTRSFKLSLLTFLLHRNNMLQGGLIFCLVLLYIQETHSWTVQHNDSVCMVMTFNASIVFNEDGFDNSTFIPLHAVSDGSICGSSFSIFHLEYDLDDDHEVTLSFGFNKTKSEWMMTKIETELFNKNTSNSYVHSTKDGYEEFHTPLGHYVRCESHILIEDVSLTFEGVEIMQPFATSEDPGEDHECEADDEPHDSKTGLIVGCVLAGSAVAFVSCCICSRMRSRRHDRYRRSPHYVR